MPVHRLHQTEPLQLRLPLQGENQALKTELPGPLERKLGLLRGQKLMQSLVSHGATVAQPQDTTS